MARLSLEAREAVTWAAAYVRALASGIQVITEHRVSYTSPDAFAPGGTSEVFYGTADALLIHPPGNLADLIDYKSGTHERDHRPQLAGYALAFFSMRTRLKTVRCHVLYGRSRDVDSWTLTQAEAAGTVLPILKTRSDPRRVPVACDYCALCRERPTCPALTEQVSAVARVNEWQDLAAALREPASISDPVLAAKALTLARFVTAWADAVRAKATEFAKAGAVLPGYRLQERRGPREVADLGAAFQRTGLTPNRFLSACKLSLSKLAEAYATERGLSKAVGTRELETKLADLIVEGRPAVSLVPNSNGEH